MRILINSKSLISKYVSEGFAKRRIELFITASVLIHFCGFFLAILLIFSSRPLENLRANLPKKENKNWIKIDFSQSEQKIESPPENYSALAARDRTTKEKDKAKRKNCKSKSASSRIAPKIKNNTGKKAILAPSKKEGRDEQIAKNKGDSSRGKDIPIPLNTKKFEYVSYFSKVKAAIQTSWKYPGEAIKMGQNGDTTVQIHINRDGTLAKVSIYSSSGVRILDEESTRAVTDASPFDPIPKEIEADQLNIVATFSYHLGFVTE